MTGLDVGAAFGVAAGWIRQSVSDSTWTAYSKVWKEWSLLVREAGVETLGSEGRLLVLYLVARNMEKGCAASSIDRKLAGLSFLFKLMGGEDWTRDFWVRQALKGYRKQHKKRDARRPVTFANLISICEMLKFVCLSQYEIRLFTAAFSLAFYGAFWIGELVSPSKRVGGGLFDHDVRLERGRVCLRLRKSKTDQQGKGVDVYLFELPGSMVCPVEAVRAFRLVRCKGAGPFLRHEDGSYLSRFQFVTIFRRCLQRAGLVGYSWFKGKVRSKRVPLSCVLFLLQMETLCALSGS